MIKSVLQLILYADFFNQFVWQLFKSKKIIKLKEIMKENSNKHLFNAIVDNVMKYIFFICYKIFKLF